jgi:anaerobic selenocysteine-containing dehydrogenase
MPFGWRGATMTAAVAPVMSKLFQESHLRALGGRVHINPATAAACGLADGESARVTTAAGTLAMPVVVDASVMPGLLHAAVGPVPNKTATAVRPEGEGVLALCTLQDDGSWRFTEASIGKA